MRVFKGMLEALDRSEKSRFAQHRKESKTGPIRRALRVLSDTELEYLEEAVSEERREFVVPVVDLFRRFNGLQQLRRNYGADPIDCPRQLGLTTAYPGARIVPPDEIRRIGLQYRPVLDSPSDFSVAR